MLEKEIERKVCDYAKKQGLLVYKFTSPQRRAVPDRLFICEGGRMFFVEFKAPGKSPTRLQEAEHVRLRNQGATVYVADDVEQGKAIILLESSAAKLI